MAAIATLVKRLREGDATKEDELQILDQVGKAAEEGDAYIHKLFSPDMIGWVRAQLKADLFPDVMYKLEAEADRRATAEAEALTALQKLEKTEARIAELETELVAADEKYARDMAGMVDQYQEATHAHADTMGEMMQAERVVKALTLVAAEAWLSGKKVTANQLREILNTRAPEFPKWSSENPDAFEVK